jgi:hypothetical protein
MRRKKSFYQITMDYEFLDDTYSVLREAGEENELEEVWDNNGRLLPHAKPYTSSR